MAIYVKCQKPNELLDRIKKTVDNSSIVTWKYDEDGDFYHTPEQWEHSGWLRPYIEDERLFKEYCKLAQVQ